MPTITLSAPFFISARLLPAVKVGNVTISIDTLPRDSDGRTRYRYFMDMDRFKHIMDEKSRNLLTGDDLTSGCLGGDYKQGMGSLLAFLEHEAESSEDSQWPAWVRPWAKHYSDEISMVRFEIEGEE